MLGTDDKVEIKVEAPRGGKFTIKTDRAGFFYVHMESGGKRPPICDQKFTTRKLVKSALDRYFKSKPEITPRIKKSKE